MKISTTTSIFRYSPAGVLRVTGEDAGSFLQGQFTNDLSPVKPGGSAYGLWLDRKGRVIADSQVVRTSSSIAEFWIASVSSPAAVIEAHLGGHIIADDVVLEDQTPDWLALSLIGKGSGDFLAAQPRTGFFFPGRRTSEENWEWFYRQDDAATVDAAVAGSGTLAGEDMERMRIASAIPSVPVDIGPSDLPNEGGLDKVAISYSKGCYLGQEVMARIKSMGRVRRALVRVHGSGPLPPLPAALWRGERREGELRSAISDGEGFSGLALVSVTAVSEGGPLSLAVGAVSKVDFVPGP